MKKILQYQLFLFAAKVFEASLCLKINIVVVITSKSMEASSPPTAMYVCYPWLWQAMYCNNRSCDAVYHDSSPLHYSQSGVSAVKYRGSSHPSTFARSIGGVRSGSKHKGALTFNNWIYAIKLHNSCNAFCSLILNLLFFHIIPRQGQSSWDWCIPMIHGSVKPGVRQVAGILWRRGGTSASPASPTASPSPTPTAYLHNIEASFPLT